MYNKTIDLYNDLLLKPEFVLEKIGLKYSESARDKLKAHFKLIFDTFDIFISLLLSNDAEKSSFQNSKSTDMLPIIQQNAKKLTGFKSVYPIELTFRIYFLLSGLFPEECLYEINNLSEKMKNVDQDMMFNMASDMAVAGENLMEMNDHMQKIMMLSKELSQKKNLLYSEFLYYLSTVDTPMTMTIMIHQAITYLLNPEQVKKDFQKMIQGV